MLSGGEEDETILRHRIVATTATDIDSDFETSSRSYLQQQQQA